jgi:hypothetical protein
MHGSRKLLELGLGTIEALDGNTSVWEVFQLRFNWKYII